MATRDVVFELGGGVLAVLYIVYNNTFSMLLPSLVGPARRKKLARTEMTRRRVGGVCRRTDPSG